MLGLQGKVVMSEEPLRLHHLPSCMYDCCCPKNALNACAEPVGLGIGDNGCHQHLGTPHNDSFRTLRQYPLDRLNCLLEQASRRCSAKFQHASDQYAEGESVDSSQFGDMCGLSDIHGWPSIGQLTLPVCYVRFA